MTWFNPRNSIDNRAAVAAMETEDEMKGRPRGFRDYAPMSAEQQQRAIEAEQRRVPYHRNTPVRDRHGNATIDTDKLRDGFRGEYRAATWIVIVLCIAAAAGAFGSLYFGGG